MAIAVLVLGMHRSGTSATAGVLHLAGVDFGRNLTPPRDENPRGFFEHDDVWQLHQRLLWELGSWSDDIRALPARWPEGDAAKRIGDELFQVLAGEFATSALWGVKDPRLSRLFPLWPPILQRLAADPRIVVTLRHPLESARSLVQRDGLELSHALGLWLRHTLDAELATRDLCRGIVHFPDLLADWRATLRRIDTALGTDLATLASRRQQEITSFLDRSLRHQHAPSDWLGAACPMPISAWCDQVYGAMLRSPDQDALDAIDQVAARVAELDSQVMPFSVRMRHGIADIGHLRSAARWLEIERGRLSAVIDSLSNRAREQELQAQQAVAAQQQLQGDLAGTRSRIEALEIQLHELNSRLIDARKDLEAVHRSRSWRSTMPMRKASQRIRALRTRLRRLF